MWVTCLQENFSRGLATVGRAVASRATLPVTQNVLLQADGNRLKITATNLEIAISTWIGAQIEGEGAVTIPARTLADFVNLLPRQKVEIDLTTDPWGINLKCANFTANLNGNESRRFPTDSDCQRRRLREYPRRQPEGVAGTRRICGRN